MDPGLLSNRYEVIRPIGTGGMTRVLEARDRLTGRRVAIKVPIGRFANDKMLLVRLEREVAGLTGFSHPNVAAVHAVERHGGAGFVVAELVEAPSLRAMLAARGPLPPPRAARAAAGVCAALAAAHARGIVHGHLTPANVLLTVDGRVKLTDFRLAQAARPFVSAPHPAADLWALGRCLAAMLTGREPADGGPVRLSPEVPPELAAIVARVVDDAVDPYRSAADLGRDLDRFLATLRPGSALADRQSVPLAQDPPAALKAIPSGTRELLPSTTRSSRRRVAGGLTALLRRRRRGRAVAAGLAAVGLAVSGLVTVVLAGGRQPGAVGGDLASPAPPSTVAQVTPTSRAPSAPLATTAQPTTTSTAPVPGAPAATSPPTTRVVGPNRVVVPNVVGLRQGQASNVLAQARLGTRVSLATVRDPGQIKRVVAQQPVAGAVVPAGDEVTVLIGTKRPTGG